uniref:DUF4371 domain-containing protein n=1 Tax=Nicotiana tabacum TaxID=4097 RepID=A0A1S4BRH3_TOBAC|nr:PREDICTED: uncharacterized protein LOC107811123 [Nicotiana tabacum]
MAIVLCYVDRMGSMVVRFIGIVHVRDTGSLYLKEAIVNYLAQHSLSLSYILSLLMLGLEKKELRKQDILEHVKHLRFLSCLMRDVLVITNELNASLQKKEQDITNVVLLVDVARKRLQRLRDEGWDLLIDKIIDWQLHELKECFNEETTYLLMGVACLNPVDSFSSFDIKKILRVTELYPDDFDENIMITLENQLATYIVNIRDVDERFSNLKGLSDLSEKLVKTKKHLNYPFVFRLVKFALLLPVATATVERTFSTMKLIKSEL